MAHFFNPKEPTRGPANCFNLATSQSVTARLWNVGGPDLQILSDDVSTAEVRSPKEVEKGVTEFSIFGKKAGNSTIRAKTAQGAQWALTQAVVAASPGGTGAPGPIYPTAASPWKGSTTFFPVVQSVLPPTDNCGDSQHHLTVNFKLLGQPLVYVLIPHCVGPLGDCKVAYYVAWNKRDQLTEYAVPPHELNAFIDNAAKFFVIAAEWFMFNNSKYQIASSKAVYHMNEAISHWSLDELKACAKTLGMAWFEAMKDPGWWSLVLPAHMMLATPKPPVGLKGPPPPPAGAGAGAAADGAAAGAADSAGAAPKGGLQQGKNIFPRPGGVQPGENLFGRGAPRGVAEPGAPEGGPRPGAPEPAGPAARPTPQALKAMRLQPSLPGAEMQSFVEGTLENSQALKSLASGASPEQVMAEFTKETGVVIEEVEEGAIQKLRGKGDVASARTKEGFLQIEKQVFKDPKLLKDVLAHDGVFCYVRNGQMVAKLASNKIFDAMTFLEAAIKNGGRLPQVYLDILAGR
jgi:hypothetical protein